MKRYDMSGLTDADVERLCRRNQSGLAEAFATAREIIDDVKRNGAAALRKHTLRLDRVDIPEPKVSEADIAAAAERVPPDLVRAVETAMANIERFHRAGMTGTEPVETMPGVTCWTESRPIERVGLYVPAGTASLVSTVLMLAVPARLAGCARVVVCVPPDREGRVADAVLAACRLCGIDEVYRAGGAQAVAALACGNAGIPRVDKIFGPGNRYVTAAKMLVAADPDGAAIDMAAGPSEVLVIVDREASARFAAADLLAQAEHDPDARTVLVSPDADKLAEVEEEVGRQLEGLPRAETARKALAESFSLLVDGLEQAVEFSNRYAPEHLVVNVRDWRKLVPLVMNAGSVFLGPYACEPAGDYASGTNHCLPTNGLARVLGGVTVGSFQKQLTFQHVTAEGARHLAPVVCRLAGAEELEAHRRAMAVRCEELEQ